MAFVRKKTMRGYTYHYFVESYREDGKVKQRTLRYLGKYSTVEAADAAAAKKAKAEAAEKAQLEAAEKARLEAAEKARLEAAQKAKAKARREAAPQKARLKELFNRPILESETKTEKTEIEIAMRELEAKFNDLALADLKNYRLLQDFYEQGKWEKKIGEDDFVKVEHMLIIQLDWCDLSDQLEELDAKPES